MLISNSSVELLSVLGSDLDVANDARVSFNKCKDEFDIERDTKLINYLAEHGHWSPFSHCYLKFRIKAPIFVARQLHKHTVGLACNEVSRRYVNYTPEVYLPTEWRAKASNKKQGSSDKTVAVDQNEVAAAINSAILLYEKLLAHGVCEEQARMVLPQNMMTEWVWSGSLYAFLRVCMLRGKEDAQRETRDVSMQIESYLRSNFPVATSAYLG